MKFPASLLRPKLPQEGAPEAFDIHCSLLPPEQFAIFVLFIGALLVLSWLFPHARPMLFLISVPFQIVIGTFFLGNAVKMKVRLSPDGLEATSTLHKQMLFGRTARSWQDLHSVRLRCVTSPAALISRLVPSSGKSARRKLDILGRSWTQQGFLLMDFRSGGMLAFPLGGIPAKDLEETFVALSRWANPLALNPDVIALQRDILTGQTACLDASYTRMWEESLNYRFQATNFVPLPGGYRFSNNHLTVLMLLACGGFSAVYLARDSKGTRLVVKELSLPLDRSPGARQKMEEMFSREARILAQLNHQQIVHVFDHFVEKGRHYLVLEFIHGLTLRQMIQMKGPLPESTVREIAVQLAKILKYLHEFDPPVIHRDITPDNLIWNEEQRLINLIDFGAAYEYVSNLTGTLIGKQSYIPPEQFRGKAGPASDIYALGGTLHFLLTGNDPEPIQCSHPRRSNRREHESEYEQEDDNKNQSEQQSLNDKISVEMDEIVAGCTEPEVENRVQSADQLICLLAGRLLSTPLAQAEE